MPVVFDEVVGTVEDDTRPDLSESGEEPISEGESESSQIEAVRRYLRLRELREARLRAD